MANKIIKGLTVEIGGDTTNLGKALDAADKQSRALSSELGEINRLLKFDEANPDLLAQKQEILTKQIAQTTEKLGLLRDAQDQAAVAFERGEVSAEQMRALQREIIASEGRLRHYQEAAASAAEQIAGLADVENDTVAPSKALAETVKAQESDLVGLKSAYAETAAAQGRDSAEAKALGEQIRTLSSLLSENRTKLNDARKSADEFDVTVQKAEKPVKTLSETVREQENELAKLKAAYTETAAAQGKDSAEAQALGSQIAALSAELSGNKAKLNDAAKAAEQFDVAARKAAEPQRTLADTVSEQRTALEKLKAEYAETAAKQGKHSDAAKELGGQIRTLSDELSKNQDRLDAAEKEANALDGTIEKTGRDVSATDRDFSKLTETLGACVKAAAAVTAAVAGAAVGMTAEVVKAYGELEQNLGGAEAVFNEIGDSIESMNVCIQGHDAETGKIIETTRTLAEVSEDAYKTMGISQSEYLANLNKMGALFQGSGLEQQESLDLSAQAMQRAADVASVMGIDISAAMESVTGAAKGNFTMMDNLGVAMNATTLEAYALKKGLIAESESAVDVKKVADAQDKARKATLDVEKAQISYNAAVAKYGENSAQAQKALVSLEKTQVSLDTATRHVEEAMAGADESASGWWKSASNADKARVAMQMFLETTEQYDGNFAREATETISGSLGLLGSAWDSLVAGLGNGEADIENLTDNVIDGFLAVTENVMPVIESVGAALPTAFRTLISGAKTQLPDLMPIAMNTLSEIITALMDAIPNIASELLRLILQLAPALISSILSLITELTELLLEMSPEILEALLQIAAQILTELSDVLPELLMLFASQIVPQLILVLLDGLPMLIECGITLLTALVEALPEIIMQICEVLPKIIDSITNVLLMMLPQLIQCGITLLTSLVDALPQIIQTVCTVLPQIITSVVNALTDMIPLLIECGIELFLALIDAMPEIITTIVDVMPDIIDSIVDALLSMLPQIIDCGIQLFVALIKAYPEIISRIVSVVPQIISAIVRAFRDRFDQIRNIGKDLISGLWNGISDMAGWIYDKIAGFASGIIGKVKDVFGIASPSKVFRQEIGRNLPRGLAAGVEDEAETAVDAVQDMADEIADVHFPISQIDFNRITPEDNPVSFERSLQTQFGDAAYDRQIMILDPEVIAKLDSILSAIERGQVLYLDGDAFIGGTIDRINTELGVIEAAEQRR